VLSEPEMQKRFEDIASYTNPMTPAELVAFIQTEQALWKPVIEQISTLQAVPK
jgi:tripartite-type tricarboxylate transporter receptor subunit TctC